MKKIIKKEIYQKDFPGYNHNVLFSDLPKDIQDNDIIEIVREDGYISENESSSEWTILVIHRMIEETDEEYKERIEEENRYKEEMKERRYQNYLKLKKEFESNS